MSEAIIFTLARISLNGTTHTANIVRTGWEDVPVLVRRYNASGVNFDTQGFESVTLASDWIRGLGFSNAM